MSKISGLAPEARPRGRPGGRGKRTDAGTRGGEPRVGEKKEREKKIKNFFIFEKNRLTRGRVRGIIKIPPRKNGREAVLEN